MRGGPQRSRSLGGPPIAWLPRYCVATCEIQPGLLSGEKAAFVFEGRPLLFSVWKWGLLFGPVVQRFVTDLLDTARFRSACWRSGLLQCHYLRSDACRRSRQLRAFEAGLHPDQ